MRRYEGVGKLVFGMMQSLDGYVDGVAGGLELPPPGVALGRHWEFAAIQKLYAGCRRALESPYAEDLPLSARERDTILHLVLRSPPGKPFMTAAGRSGFCPICLAVVPFTDTSNQLSIVFETSAPVQPPDWPNTPLPRGVWGTTARTVRSPNRASRSPCCLTCVEPDERAMEAEAAPPHLMICPCSST